MWLQGKRLKEKYHSYTGDAGKVADNIIDRDFSADAPFQKWPTVVSLFSLRWNKCYLSPLLDMYSNEIVSYDLLLLPDLAQILRILDSAFEKFPDTDGLVFHSDQMWLYWHMTYRATLKEHGIIQSMSRKGNCIMESFYSHEKEYFSFEEFSKAVEEYIDYYNNERIQAKIKWMPR